MKSIVFKHGLIFESADASLRSSDIPRAFIHKLLAFIGGPRVFLHERAFSADVSFGCGCLNGSRSTDLDQGKLNYRYHEVTEYPHN